MSERKLLYSATVEPGSPPPGSPTSMENPRDDIMGKLSAAWSKATKGTVVSSIFILLTTCIGAGTLSLPYALSQGGIIVFSLIFFLIMLMSIYVGAMLLSSKRYCTEVYPHMDVWSYEDLAYATFGVVGRIASLITIASLLYLALIAYMIYTRDQLAAVMQLIVMKTGMDGCTPLLNCGVLMCLAFFPIFPVTLLRKLTPLQFTSCMSIISIIIVAICITANTIVVLVKNKNELPLDHTIHVRPHGFGAVLTVIGYCSLSFICHFNLLPLQKEFAVRPSKAKMYSIIVGAILTAYFIYNVVIFAAYFNFYGDIKPDVMLNYRSDNKLITAARAFLFLTLLLHYPVLLHPTRANINGAVYLIYQVLFKKKDNAGSVQDKPLLSDSPSHRSTKEEYTREFKVPMVIWFLETVAIFSTTFIIATFISNVAYVWNFVSSTGGVLVLYIYPSAFYLRLRYVRYKTRAEKIGTSIRAQYDVYAILKEGVAWVIFFIGLVLLVVENYQAITAVIKGGGNNTNSTDVCNIFCMKDININSSSGVLGV